MSAQRLAPLLLSLVLPLCGCAGPQTGVIRLGDGVMKAANMQEAEAFCRTTGDPVRLAEQAPAPGQTGVLFRCD